jgi:copper chaperone CopZ|tara:strand:+ start:2835 stop:3047 length:213 start_codon:yes stop_codon:yes gene_type:complete
VTREVNKLPGIIEVTFDQAAKVASVTYDTDKVSADLVRKAIEAADREIAAENAPRPDIGSILGTDATDDN